MSGGTGGGVWMTLAGKYIAWYLLGVGPIYMLYKLHIPYHIYIYIAYINIYILHILYTHIILLCIYIYNIYIYINTRILITL